MTEFADAGEEQPARLAEATAEEDEAAPDALPPVTMSGGLRLPAPGMHCG